MKAIAGRDKYGNFVTFDGGFRSAMPSAKVARQVSHSGAMVELLRLIADDKATAEEAKKLAVATLASIDGREGGSP